MHLDLIIADSFWTNVEISSENENKIVNKNVYNCLVLENRRGLAPCNPTKVLTFFKYFKNKISFNLVIFIVYMLQTADYYGDIYLFRHEWMVHAILIDFGYKLIFHTSYSGSL